MVMIATVYDFYSPFDKGIYIGLTAIIFPFFGLVNGYVSARMYTFFNGTSWFTLACCADAFLPVALGALFILIDGLESFERNAHKLMPAYDTMLLAIYWIFVHVPLCTFGTGIGFYKNKLQAPTKPSRIPREPVKAH